MHKIRRQPELFGIKALGGDVDRTQLALPISPLKPLDLELAERAIAIE